MYVKINYEIEVPDFKKERLLNALVINGDNIDKTKYTGIINKAIFSISLKDFFKPSIIAFPMFFNTNNIIVLFP